MAVQTVERRGDYSLDCYPLNGWAIFKHAPDGKATVVANGRFKDVWPVYARIFGLTH